MHRTPSSLSDFHRTYNNAIDLVAEAAGWALKQSPKPVAAIVLKPSRFEQFVKGVEVLQKGELSEEEKQGLTFQGIKILKGSMGQIDSLRMEFVENVYNIKPAYARN